MKPTNIGYTVAEENLAIWQCRIDIQNLSSVFPANWFFFAKNLSQIISDSVSDKETIEELVSRSKYISSIAVRIFFL